MIYSLPEMQRACWKNAELKGWHDDDEPMVEKLCLIHAEVSEALEEWRDGHAADEIYYDNHDNASVTPGGLAKPEGVPIELADVIIRTLDLAQIYGIELVEAIDLKLAYNRTRSFRHGGKRA